MKVLDKISQELKNASYGRKVRGAKIKDAVNLEVPYVCQFATPEHAEMSLKRKLSPAEDTYWKESGASSPERYADWAFTMCGMACSAMALEYFEQKKMLPAVLAEDALKEGVYIESPKEISSMRYQEFSEWIRKYDLVADIYTKLSVKGIEYALSEGKLVIVSVNPNIRGYDTAPADQKGGHLVLVTGYDLQKGTVSINNPSGFVSTNTQINHTLPIQEFTKFYAGRGIVLSQNLHI